MITKEILESLDKVAVRFTADWCGPCKHLAPTFDKVRDEFTDTISSMVVDVGLDEGKELCEVYGILGIPAVLFLKNGEVVSLMVGNQPTEEVRRRFQELKDKE